MRPAVLVTRPEPGLEETAGAVRAQGWRAVACPVMRMVPSPPLADHPCRAMLVTSGQALPFLARQDRDRLLLTVGRRTAERAMAMGFRNVEAASGTQDGLEALCRQKGLDGPDLMLACGRGRHGQPYGIGLAESLGARWVEAYQVHPMRALPGEALEVLEAGEAGVVLFYSSETVALFMELCPPELHGRLAQCRCLCLSHVIAGRAGESGRWRTLEVGDPLKLLGVRRP